MEFQIESKRLLLRVETPEKARDVLTFYQNNKEIFEAFEPTRPANFYTAGYQKSMLNYEYQEILKGHFLRYFVYLKEYPETIIGSVNFSNIQQGPFKKAAIGYKFDKKYWGNGYAYEACLTCIQIMAEDYKLHKIEAHVSPANQPSIKLMNRLHFTFEGTEFKSVEINGQWQDHYRYGLVLF